MLRTTPRGFKIIKDFEGCEKKVSGGRLKSYRCPANVWTVGWGTTTGALPGIAVFAGLTITQAQADEWLRDTIDAFEDKIERMLGTASARVTPNQFDAMVSLAYNIGLGAFSKSSVLRLTKAGKYSQAARAFLLWNKAKVDGVSRVMPGLTRRRKAEMALYLDEVETAERIAASLTDEALPQAVERRKIGGEMAKSKIGNGTIASGGLGVFAAGNEIADQVSSAASAGKSAWEALADASPWLIVVLAIAAIGVFVWNERRNKMVEEDA